MHLLVDGPARAWKVLLACENQKKLDLLEMPTFHWPGTQILFRHKQKKLATASPLFHFFYGFICLGFWKEFFPVFQFLSWSNLVLLFTEAFANGFENWFVYKWIDFWFSSWNMAFFIGFISVWIETCMKCWNLFFLRNQVFSITPLGDTLV